MKSIKEGRNVEIGGFLKLGETASTLKIGSISQEEISITSVGGREWAVTKGSASELERLKDELTKNPNKTISTMILNNRRYDGREITYSVKLLKRYGALGFKYIAFQKDEKFDGWILSGNFLLQLPEEDAKTFSYDQLKQEIVGINKQSVNSRDNAREVLSKMKELQLDVLPVVEDDRLLFFTTRGEILSSLMTKIMLDKEPA